MEGLENRYVRQFKIDRDDVFGGNARVQKCRSIHFKESGLAATAYAGNDFDDVFVSPIVYPRDETASLNFVVHCQRLLISGCFCLYNTKIPDGGQARQSTSGKKLDAVKERRERQETANCIAKANELGIQLDVLRSSPAEGLYVTNDTARAVLYGRIKDATVFEKILLATGEDNCPLLKTREQLVSVLERMPEDDALRLTLDKKIEEALVAKIPGEKIDIALYESVVSVVAKAALYGKMPESVKESISTASTESPSQEPTTSSQPSMRISVGDVNIANINMDDVVAAIKTWQKDRWKSDKIVALRKSKGKVGVDDLKISAHHKDIQPFLDIMVADYVIYVNILDSFVDAQTPQDAVAMLLKSLSMDDFLKMAKALAGAIDSAKSLKDNAGWKDVIPIGKICLS